MENENVKAVAETMARSLDDMQRNSTDTEGCVNQVLSLTGKDNHDKTVSAILADDGLSMQDKLKLIHSENSDYDRREENNVSRVARLQDVRTQNVGRATSWWAENWGWVAAFGATVLTVGTPQGRKLLASVSRSLAA